MHFSQIIEASRAWINIHFTDLFISWLNNVETNNTTVESTEHCFWQWFLSDLRTEKHAFHSIL